MLLVTSSKLPHLHHYNRHLTIPVQFSPSPHRHISSVTSHSSIIISSVCSPTYKSSPTPSVLNLHIQHPLNSPFPHVSLLTPSCIPLSSFLHPSPDPTYPNTHAPTQHHPPINPSPNISYISLPHLGSLSNTHPYPRHPAPPLPLPPTPSCRERP